MKRNSVVVARGDRGAAAPSGQVPAALPNASSAARRSRAAGRVGVCGALPVPRSGSRRPDDRRQCLGLERCRNGSFVKARGYKRVCRGSSDFTRRLKVVSAPAGRYPYRSRPARAAALSFAGVPETTRFRRRRAPLVTRLGAALVGGTRGQRIEEASGFIGRVIAFCGLETSPAASRRLSCVPTLHFRQ